jgi:hypothetical protein
LLPLANNHTNSKILEFQLMFCENFLIPFPQIPRFIDRNRHQYQFVAKINRRNIGATGNGNKKHVFYKN